MTTPWEASEVELMKMKIGDSIKIQDATTRLQEILRVPNGFIYVFESDDYILHTQFILLGEPKDLRTFRG